MKDSHGLFDYESKQTTDQEHKLDSPCRLVRRGHAVEVRGSSPEPGKPSDSTSQPLATVGRIRHTFWVFSAVTDSVPQPLWLGLRNFVSPNGESGARVALFDTIKLGRCKYLISELVLDRKESEQQTSPQNVVVEIVGENRGEEGRPRFESDALTTQLETVRGEPWEKKAVPQIEPRGPDEPDRCRICLGSESAKENPLIGSPCKCAGSVQLVHVSCLQQWLRSKVTQRATPFVATYIWKNLECDVCKAKYPGTDSASHPLQIDSITLPDGHTMELLQIQRPGGNYMLLRSVHTSENNSTFLCRDLVATHIISFGKKQAFRMVYLTAREREI